jgi:uncharacterized protein YndB with AHSA1/START domain
MILRFVLLVLILVAGVLAFAAAKPDTFHVQKAVTINAPPEKVFALVGDFHNWPRWAPQDRDDRTMQRSYGGAAAGTGAVSDWTSRGSAGAGRMTITEAAPASKVVVAVDLQKPFRVRNSHVFTLTPSGTGTEVTWTAEGTNLYMMKVMEVFVGVDGLMGKHFATGLENLKSLAEE